MTHPVVKTDAATLLSNIPTDLQTAFAEFLDAECDETRFTQYTYLHTLRAAFHNYCRQVAEVEPAEGTQIERLCDVAGYLPQWSQDRQGNPQLVVRGIRLKDVKDAA